MGRSSGQTDKQALIRAAAASEQSSGHLSSFPDEHRSPVTALTACAGIWLTQQAEQGVLRKLPGFRRHSSCGALHVSDRAQAVSAWHPTQQTGLKESSAIMIWPYLKWRSWRVGRPFTASTRLSMAAMSPLKTHTSDMHHGSGKL